MEAMRSVNATEFCGENFCAKCTVKEAQDETTLKLIMLLAAKIFINLSMKRRHKAMIQS